MPLCHPTVPLQIPYLPYPYHTHLRFTSHYGIPFRSTRATVPPPPPLLTLPYPSQLPSPTCASPSAALHCSLLPSFPFLSFPLLLSFSLSHCNLSESRSLDGYQREGRGSRDIKRRDQTVRETTRDNAELRDAIRERARDHANMRDGGACWWHFISLLSLQSPRSLACSHLLDNMVS